MANIALTGQVPLEINHSQIITATNFSVKFSQPVTVRKGAYGVIGKSKGIPDVSGSMTFAVPAAKAEFNSLAGAGGDDLTITFSEGQDRYMVLGVAVNDYTLTNDPGAGNADKQVSFIGTEIVQVA